METEIFTETSVDFRTTGATSHKAEAFTVTAVRSPFRWDTVLCSRWYIPNVSINHLNPIETTYRYCSLCMVLFCLFPMSVGAGFLQLQIYVVESQSVEREGEQIISCWTSELKETAEGKIQIFDRYIPKKKGDGGPKRGISQTVWLFLVPVSIVAWNVSIWSR